MVDDNDNTKREEGLQEGFVYKMRSFVEIVCILVNFKCMSKLMHIWITKHLNNATNLIMKTN